MPFFSVGRRLAVAATTLVALAASAAPAAAGCPAQPTTKPFAPWLDFADYVLAPDGDAENGAAAWTFAGGAGVVAGNEPYQVGGLGDVASVRLPAGGSATTAPMCLGTDHPTIRLFAKGEHVLSTLRVEALFTDRTGRIRALPIGSNAGLGAWWPTPPLPVVANTFATISDGTMIVAFRFSSPHSGTWAIDDVYVDPYRTG